MNSKLLNWETSLKEMKNEFDFSFANLPPILDSNEKKDFLIIQIHHNQYAVHVDELKGLQIKKVVVPIPCENKSLLGLAGIQGQVIPVFSLAFILNIQSPVKEGFGKENNFIICGKNSKIGLSFLKIGNYHKINKKNIIPQQTKQNNFVSFMLRFSIPGSKELAILPLLDLASITDFILKKN